MSEITKKALSEQNAVLRNELGVVKGRLHDSETAKRSAERRLRDLRISLEGVSQSRTLMEALVMRLEEAKTELAGQVLRMELPPEQSGAQTMNDFIAGPVVDGTRDKSQRG